MFHAIGSALKTKGWGPTGSGPPPTDRLTPPTKDSLFLYQLQNHDPAALNEGSLLVAKICETKHYAHSIFGSLTKLGVVDASTGRPDTTKIDKSFVSKIGIISVPKQRELVDLLFWWEEELTRWRLLDEEQAEIEGVTSAAGEGSLEDEAELFERMRVIEAKRRVLPSLRKSDGSLKVTEEQPPEYAS